MNQILLDTVRDGSYDLVFLAKTDSVDYALLDEINEYAYTWYYYMDPMDVAHRINAKEYARRATWASATFSDVTQHFQQAGARAYWIPQGIDPELFAPTAVEKTHDVVFAGTKNPKRAALTEYLRQHGISVACYGSGWKNAPVFLDELVNLYRRTKIVLNICRPGAGFSVRVFQVMGTGAFLLSEYCLDLEALFERGEYLDWFRDADEMVALVKRYLRKEALRERVAEAGCRRVNEQHTWSRVMHEIVERVEGKSEQG